MTRRAEVPWTDDRIAQIRMLWDEGHSTAEIGRRMGISKNAVVGKARRLNLPARPSPIITGAGMRIVQPKRAPRATLPIEKSLDNPERVARLEAGWVHQRPATPAPATIAPPYVGRITECAFVTRTGRPALYCEAPTLPGKPYCQQHYARCVVRGGPADAAHAA